MNGADSQPIYAWFRTVCPATQAQLISDPSLISWAPVGGSDIRWNFEKFIIDRTGHVAARFSPEEAPQNLIPTIDALLQKAL